MKKPQITRLLRLEALENRIVFASNLAAMASFVQQDSMYREIDLLSISNKTNRLTARDHASMQGEGEGNAVSSSALPSSVHAFASAPDLTPSVSASLDTASQPTHAVSTATHHLNSNGANHQATAIETRVATSLNGSASSTVAAPLVSFSSFQVDRLSSSAREESVRSLVPISNSSMMFRTPTVDDMSKISTFRSTATVAQQPAPEDSQGTFGLAAPENQSVSSLDRRREAAGFSRSAPSSGQTLDKPPAVHSLAIDQEGLFSEYLSYRFLPDEPKDASTHPWLSLFGVVQPTSPFSGDLEHSESARARIAILEVVAQSEESDAASVEPPAVHSSNGWKATSSILAAAFAAIIYRTKRQQDLEPHRSTLRKKRLLPSDRDSC